MPREAMVGDGRVARCGEGRERAEGVVAGFRAGHEGSARPTEGRDVAQVVGVGVEKGPNTSPLKWPAGNGVPSTTASSWRGGKDSFDSVLIFQTDLEKNACTFVFCQPIIIP